VLLVLVAATFTLKGFDHQLTTSGTVWALPSSWSTAAWA
jgi:hypothetical protein